MKKKTFRRICFLLIAILAVVLFIAPEFVGQAEADTIYENIPIAGDQGQALPFWAWIKRLVQDFFWSLISLVLLVINSVFLGALAVAEMLFNAIASPGFISESFTGPDNPFVYPNWILIRDLANIGIILGVVFCGLKMAFGLDSRATKKSLVTLIALAFLINFTPVLLGLLIDAAQIAMNQFMGPGLTQTTGMASGVMKAFANIRDIEENQMVAFIQMLTMGAVCLFLAFIYFVLAIVFLVRYIVLWVLVILSPLAFLAYAFKGGQKIWNMWWSNFISWTFVGVPIAFFVALAGWMYGYGQPLWDTTARNMALRISDEGLAGSGVISSEVFAPIFPGILIVIGFMISLNIAPAFAKTVMDYTKKGAHGAAAWSWGKVRYRTRDLRDKSRREVHARHVKEDAQALGINTAGWDDPKRSYAVRAQVAKELQESNQAKGAQKAHAARYLDVQQKIDERKLEHSRFAKKLKDASEEELDALIYQPTPQLVPHTKTGVAKKRALALQEAMSRDKGKALKKFKNLASLSEEEILQTAGAFASLGPAYQGTLENFLVAASGKHGKTIKEHEEALGIEKGSLDKAIKKLKAEDNELLAHVYQNASEENQRLLLDNLIEADTKTIISTIRRLKAEERGPFAFKLKEAAERAGGVKAKNFQHTARFLNAQWYLTDYEKDLTPEADQSRMKIKQIVERAKVIEKETDQGKRQKEVAEIVSKIISSDNEQRSEIMNRIAPVAPSVHQEALQETIRKELIGRAKQIRRMKDDPRMEQESKDLSAKLAEDLKKISPKQWQEFLKEDLIERVYEFQQKIKNAKTLKEKKKLGNRMMQRDILDEISLLDSKDQKEITDLINKIYDQEIPA